MLNLFIDATQNDGGRWPSRIRVDYGVENVLVCDAMTKNEKKVAAASSQDLQQETNESKDCGGMSFVVLSIVLLYLLCS